MRILLADDQEDVRSGLRILLEQETEWEIVGEAEGVKELLLLTQKQRPDLVLLDWELSCSRVSDVIPLLRALNPQLHIIALSGRPEARAYAMAAGVDGFVSKGDHPETLLDTIRRIGS